MPTFRPTRSHLRAPPRRRSKRDCRTTHGDVGTAAKRLTAEQALPDGRSASINAAGVASRTFEAFTNVVIIPFLVVAFAATPRPYLSRLIALVPQRKKAGVRYRLASDAHTMPLESCSVTSRSRNFRSAKENETSRDLKSAERRKLS